MLVGPSGCGKTTALRLVNRMIELSDGDILIDGVSIRTRPAAELRRGIGYVIQQIGLFPHLTIGDNIARRAAACSGGTEQRIARARRGDARARLPAGATCATAIPAQLSGRPAPAHRRGARARGGPAADADGRALRRDRPDQPRAAPEPVPAPPVGDPQDDPVRHPRHRRGDQDGRPRGRACRRAGCWRSTRRRRSC